MDLFWIILGSVLGSFWDCSGVVLGSLWGRFGIGLGSFWDRFGIVLGSFWNRFRKFFGVVLDSVLCRFGIVLGSFWNRVGVEMPKKKKLDFHAVHPGLPTSPLEGFAEKGSPPQTPQDARWAAPGQSASRPPDAARPPPKAVSSYDLVESCYGGDL